MQILDIVNDEIVSETMFRINENSRLTDYKIELFKMISPFTRNGGILDNIESRRNLGMMSAAEVLDLDALTLKYEITNEYLISLGGLLRVYPIIGGLLWGLLLVTIVSLSLPRIYRFEAFANRVFFSMIKAWFVVSVWRFALVTLISAPSTVLLYLVWKEGFLTKIDLLTLLIPTTYLVTLLCLQDF